jgi:hypothetical protein
MKERFTKARHTPKGVAIPPLSHSEMNGEVYRIVLIALAHNHVLNHHNTDSMRIFVKRWERLKAHPEFENIRELMCKLYGAVYSLKHEITQEMLDLYAEVDQYMEPVNGPTVFAWTERTTLSDLLVYFGLRLKRILFTLARKILRRTSMTDLQSILHDRRNPFWRSNRWKTKLCEATEGKKMYTHLFDGDHSVLIRGAFQNYFIRLIKEELEASRQSVKNVCILDSRLPDDMMAIVRTFLAYPVV